jgi:hypothetical protein
MKDGLKNFIDKNRPAFDDQEPPGKVWGAIESSLQGMRQTSMWNSVSLWRAAAVLFLGLSVYFFLTRTTPGLRKEGTLSQVEFIDLESFYSSQIAEKVALINDIDASGDSDPFTQDFQKLDAMYQVLREEMKNHPSEKVKDALVLNLLVRIDLLNQQIKKLEDSKRPLRKSKASVA